MLKKHAILSLLLLAYTIVLGHSIIPHHHHHDEHHETEQTSHHHDDDHDEKNEDSDFSHGLENYLHSGNTADFHQQTNIVHSISPATIIKLFTVFNFKVLPIELPPPLRGTDKQFFLKSYYCLSSKGLRAPPLFLA
jgi:hypothetical protein